MFWSERLKWQLRVRALVTVQTSGPEVDAVWQRVQQSASAGDYLTPTAPGTPLTARCKARTSPRTAPPQTHSGRKINLNKPRTPMSDDPRCCGSGTCIIDAEGICWCGQRWDGDRLVGPASACPAPAPAPPGDAPGEAARAPAHPTQR